jgi:activated CDC42 kinase 1
MNLLEFEVGQVITILDKYDNNTSAMWSGIRDDNGHVGMFSPSQTVTYLGTIPKSVSSYMTVQTQLSYQTSSCHSHDASYGSNEHFSVFQRSSLKRDSKKRLSREMISAPQDFHNVNGHMDAGSNVGPQPRLTRLSRADSDTSELAPLISRSSINASHHQQSKPANRMGHTIGYIRERSSTNQSLVGMPSTFSAYAGDHSIGKTDKHEYHSISDHEDEEDDAFFKPLDLGPSLLDEVFQELESSSAKAKETQLPALEEVAKKSDAMKDLKGLVNSTLNMRHHKKKQLATVRPIKASDERAIESAIAMANALASKSMHDLDTRSIEPFYEHSPGRSPMTPNSPSKKFSFFFPSTAGGSKSPKVERKPFTDDAKTTGDLTSCLSTGEKDAYRALVGESESLPPLSKLSPLSSFSQSIACLPMSYMNTLPADHFMQQMSPPPSHPHPLVHPHQATTCYPCHPSLTPVVEVLIRPRDRFVKIL